MLRCGVVVFALVLTGCGGDREGGEDDAKPTAGVPSAVTSAPPRTPVSPGALTSSTPEGAEEVARAEVLEVYGLMWREKAKAYRAASAKGTALKRYMDSRALEALEADLARMKKERTVMRGDLAHEPEVSTITVGAQPPTAMVEDCVDGSTWQTLDTTTGWRIPPPAGQPSRYAATARVERGAGGRWRITEYTADRTRSCETASPVSPATGEETPRPRAPGADAT